MRVDESTVLGAALGGSAEFAELVRAYEAALYSFALASTRDRDEAEDAAQEIFLKALTGIRDLRSPERFESWLFAIARNELASRARERRGRGGDSPETRLDPDEIGSEEAFPSRRAGEPGGAEEELGRLYALLGHDEALAVALKYGGGFSVREIALACGIAESTAKSRLNEARKRMRSAARGAARGGGIEGFRIPFGLEEKIMDDIETLKLGAYVLERMANADQMRAASRALRGLAFDEDILAAVGRVEGGAEFVRRVGARLSVKELASILNYSDRYTEKRVVEGLERADPEAAEALKRSMFVFEDFVLFDESALEALVGELGEGTFAVGLAACGDAVRVELLGRIGAAGAVRLRKALESARWSPESARAAQEEAIAVARRLDAEGRIAATEDPAAPRGFVFRAAERRG